VSEAAGPRTGGSGSVAVHRAGSGSGVRAVPAEPTGAQRRLGLHLYDPSGRPAGDERGPVRAGYLGCRPARVAGPSRQPGSGGERGQVRGGLDPVPGHHREPPGRTGRAGQHHQADQPDQPDRGAAPIGTGGRAGRAGSGVRYFGPSAHAWAIRETLRRSPGDLRGCRERRPPRRPVTRRRRPANAHRARSC